MAPPLPLDRYPAVHTTSLEEATEIFSRLTTPARLARNERRGRFEWRGNLVSLGAIHLSAHQYGAGIRADTELVENVFTTAFPLTDVETEGIDAGTVVPVVKDRKTWLASPDRPGGFRVGTGYRALQLTVPKADMGAALAALGDAPTTTPLRFEPSLRLDSGVGAWLHRLVRYVADEVDRDATPFASPIVGARLADTILYGLLQGHPHNHSARLASARSAEPRYVREAAEYLEAHAADPVRMADLARVTRVSVRALQLGFQKHRGCSPMDFLKERRLHLARKKLLDWTEPTVTQIALDCGFAHIGRFSAQYRARFGESPSETRARSRR